MKPSRYTTIATQYARDVVAGKMPTCKWVLAACQRQLDDLDRFKGKESPYRFNPKLPATHPKLVDVMVVQQLELLERGSHRGMVRELIVLTQASGARHVGALIQASDPGADLGVLMASVAADLMAQKSLPNPQAEWEDALRRIELESLNNEHGVLIAEGLNNLHSQQAYRKLSARITCLIKVIAISKAR